MLKINFYKIFDVIVYKNQIENTNYKKKLFLFDFALGFAS